MELSDIKERYKQIKGFEDYYITESGDVYSTRPIGIAKSGRLHKMKPKNPGRPEKYLNIILCNCSEQKTFAIHRLVAEYFVDGYFEGAVVNHKDGNNRNNNASNLEWTTIADNVHKGYITSGMSQTRNFRKWTLISPCGDIIGVFNGHPSMEMFLKENNIDASPSSLVKYGRSNGYSIIKE